MEQARAMLERIRSAASYGDLLSYADELPAGATTPRPRYVADSRKAWVAALQDAGPVRRFECSRFDIRDSKFEGSQFVLGRSMARRRGRCKEAGGRGASVAESLIGAALFVMVAPPIFGMLENGGRIFGRGEAAADLRGELRACVNRMVRGPRMAGLRPWEEGPPGASK